MNAIRDFIAECIAVTGHAPEYPEATGSIERFSTNGKRGNRDGYYSLFSDGDFLAGFVGCWRQGNYSTWHSGKSEGYSITLEQSTRIEAKRRTAEAERTKKAASRAAIAKQICLHAQPVSQHLYLVKKGIAAGSAIKTADLDKKVFFDNPQQSGMLRNCLLIPVTGEDGNIQTLQAITPDGTKFFMSGGSMKGGFHFIQGDDSEVYIAEGYATGATVHAITGATVYVAFNAGKLKEVAAIAKQRHSTVIIASDNDHAKIHNVGRKKAEQAAGELGLKVAIPEFNTGSTGTDWNDFFAEYGEQATLAGLSSTSAPAALAPAAPTDKAIISACYKQRALKLAGGIQVAAGDLHTTPELVKNEFLRHLQKKSQPFHQAAKPTRTFATIEHGYQYLQSNAASALVQAPLGSGKTQHIAAPLVKSALQNGQTVITLTVLRSLTRQNANNMGLGHYQDVNANQRQGMSATVHSLAGDKIQTLKDNMLKQKGLIIVDEAAMVAALTLNTDGILSGSEKKETLDFLRSASASGSRIIFLDADVTPMLRLLVSVVAPSAEIIKITGQQYAPPKLNLIVEQSLLTEGSKPKSSNGLGMAIKQAIADGKKVAVACLTRAEALAIHEAYGANTKSIVLHSENTGETEQAELLADPEQYSEQYDLITYSPVLGAGFSVAGHERTLFASFSYATLHPTGMMQIVRRFRRAAGGVINIGIDPSLQKPQRRYVGAEHAVNEIISDIGIQAFDDPFVAGAVIAYQTEQLAASNPFHAFVGHALNQGFEIDFIYPSSLAGTDEKIAAKKAVKEAAIQSIMDVQTPDAIEYERLKAAPATDETAAPVKRYEIETALCIGVGEHDLLTEEVVDAALNQRLMERTDKAALLIAVDQGATFTESPEAALSFAFKKHTQKQVELMQEIVRMITNDAGVISITGSDALRVADAMRGKIRHFHNLLNAPKRQNLSKSVHIAWLRGLLGCWGFVSVHKERVGDGSKGADQYQYTYDIDAILTPFVHRKAAIYVDAQKRLKAA